MARGDTILATHKRRLVTALLTTQTVADAAKEAGVSLRTAQRYLRDPAVKRALSEALDNMLAGVTRQVVGEMTGAVHTLSEVHQDHELPAAARVAAARALLAGGPALREATELSERVAVLEQSSEAKR